MVKRAKSTVDKAEQAKFAELADQWWGEDGAFAMLHKMSRVRMQYIADHIARHFVAAQDKPLEALDVGCGGGLASVPMARLGHRVLGIDMVQENVEAARQYAQQQSIAGLEYSCISAEELLEKRRACFDVVLALEVIEHVADVELFLASCSALLKPRGLLFVSTINKTTCSYIGAIVMAEYILRWVPVGTHDWHRFIAPDTLSSMLKGEGMRVLDTSGMHYNPIRDSWGLASDQSMNYIMCAQKAKFAPKPVSG